ncbi:MAG TPA: hypothetical protein VFE38_10605 [Edaphobacter sp.]|nr:hypothetical protein [Edaphobacter sp.]
MRETPIPNVDRLVLRWTIGKVRDRGFEMLRISIASAYKLFGPSAKYVICVNTVSLEEAQQRTGDLPVAVEWIVITHNDLPQVMHRYFDETVMEGMGWKLAPLRVCADSYELALDNDCILWGLPEGMDEWLRSDSGCLFAEDVDRCLGSFDALCPPGKFNAGIRGLAPGVNLEDALAIVLRKVTMQQGYRFRLVSEIEEQGLQAALICRQRPLFLVRTDEVSLCSPFWPRSPKFGTHGAHFVGMNAQHIPWNYYDRPADLWLQEHWESKRKLLYEKAGLPEPAV